MAKLKGFNAYITTGKEFDFYFDKLIHDYAIDEWPKSRLSDIDAIYKDFKKFVIKNADYFFKEHEIIAIVIL